MEKKRKKEKEEKTSEEKIEIFEVEKDGKEKEIIATGNIENKVTNDNPLEQVVLKENKTFRNVLILMAALILMFAATYWLVSSSNHFEYNGVKFNIDKKAMVGMTLYNTYLPVSYKGTTANYNFWLKKDPRTNKVPFVGRQLIVDQNMVLNASEELNCNGDGNVALVNLKTLYNVIGTNVIADKNASCDLQGRYMFVNVLKGNQTRIEQFGPECYNIYINNCEVLAGTEKFMVETLSAVDKTLKQSSA
jgi:hypothetical protein